MTRRLCLVIALDRGEEAADVPVSVSLLQALGGRRHPDSLRPGAIASASSEPPPEAA